MGSKIRPTFEVILIGQGPTRTVSPRKRCESCELPFEPTDAAIRVRDHEALVDHVWHRRCVEVVMDDGPVDVDRATREFQRYQRKLKRKLTLVTQ